MKPMTSEKAAVHGYSLVELLLIVSLLGLVALIATPDSRPSQRYRLDKAAAEIADAYRFARSEAMRTGNPHGVRLQRPQNRARVYNSDMGTSPPTALYTVYHPATRRLYDLDLDLRRDLRGVTMDSVNRTWTGTCNLVSYVTFDANGTPHCSDPLQVLLVSATVTLTHQGSALDVVVNGETGRVVVQ